MIKTEKIQKRPFPISDFDLLGLFGLGLSDFESFRG